MGFIHKIGPEGAIEIVTYQKPADFALEHVLPDGEGGLYLLGPTSIFQLCEGSVRVLANGFKDLSAGAAVRSKSGALYIVDGSQVVVIKGEERRTHSTPLKLPFGIAVDPRDRCYLTDHLGNTIHAIDPEGQCHRIAGTGSPGHRDGPAAQAEFCFPSGIVVDARGHLFIKESGRNESHLEPLRIRELTPEGQVTTFARINRAP